MVCKEQTTKKYTSRKSPPYKANECCGETKKGNDGMMYKSKPDKKGVCKWYKLDVKKKSPKKKASPKKRANKDFDELEYKIRELRNYANKNGFTPSELKPYLVLYGFIN